jgi:Ca2+-binding RTX toxin-like protein
MPTYNSTISFSVLDLWPTSGTASIQQVLSASNNHDTYWIQLTNGTYLRYQGFNMSYQNVGAFFIPSGGTYSTIEVTDAAGVVLASLTDFTPDPQASDIFNNPGISLLGGDDAFYASNNTDILTGFGGSDTFYFDVGDFNAADVIAGGGGFDTLALSGTDASNASFETNGASISSIEQLRFSNNGNSGTASITLNLNWVDVTGWATGLNVMARNYLLTSDNLVFNANAATSLNLSGYSFQSWNDNFQESQDTITINGSAGADIVTGSSENDDFYGNGGADQFNGGDGDDSYSFLISNVVAGSSFNGGNGFNDFIAVDGIYNVDLSLLALSNVEQLRFRFGGGAATMTASQIAGGLNGLGFKVVGSNGLNIESLNIAMGSLTNLDLTTLQFQNWETTDTFTITGDGDAETIIGTARNDRIVSGGGADSLSGMAGNDTLVLLAQNAITPPLVTSLNGGADTDTIELNLTSGYRYDLSNTTINSIEQISFTGSPTQGAVLFVQQSQFGTGLASNLALIGRAGATDQLNISMTSANSTFDARNFTATNWNDQYDWVQFFDRFGASNATIWGTQYNDVFNGYGGVDHLYGEGGQDTFYYNLTTINQTLEGEINGGSGTDTVNIAGNANTSVFLNQTLTSVETLDFTNVTPIAVTITADLFKNSGITTISDSTSGNVLFNINMNTTTTLNLSALQLTGWSTTDHIAIYGSSVGQNIKGSSGNDIIYGGGGEDSIDGGLGADEMHGGANTDLFYVDNIGDQIITSAGQGIDIIYTSLASYTLPEFISILTSNGPIGYNGTGNAAANAIYGNIDPNLAAIDVLRGGGGIDYLFGGTGNDVYLLDADGATDYGAEEGTQMFRGRLDLSLATSATTTVFGTITLIGNGALGLNGSETGYGSTTTGGGIGTDIFLGVDGVLGSQFADTMVGSTGVEIFDGRGGDDILDGGGGADIVIGGAGNDRITYDALDSMNGGDDIDFLLIGSMQIPDHFDLVENEFEFAEAHHVDSANIYNWTQLFYTYDNQWRLSQQDIFYDDTTRILTFYDTTMTKVWVTQRADYNASGQLTQTVLDLDSGTKVYEEYDVANTMIWSSLRTDYNASFQRLQQVLILDNGTRVYEEFDVDGDDPNTNDDWSSLRTDYNAALQWTQQVTNYYNGLHVYEQYDPADLQTWSYYRNDYDNTYHLLNSKLVDDSGTYDTVVYDVANTQTWNEWHRSYSATDVLLSEYFV